MDEIIGAIVGILGNTGGLGDRCLDVTGYGFAYCMADLIVRLILSLAVLGGGHIAWELRPTRRE